MKPKRTILCVDDNEQALSIRKVMLETRGYRVISCATAEEAIELFKAGGIDLFGPGDRAGLALASSAQAWRHICGHR